MLRTWYAVAALPTSCEAIRVVTLINVICVVFVTHVYETVFLVKEREADMIEVERLGRARAEAQLEALKGQIDPHFLFNSLNTLGYLIDHDPAAACEFNARLGRVYRYILGTRERPLVLLAEEVEFLDDYAALLAVRFGDALRLRKDGEVRLDRLLCPPISLQVLLENAIKHNEVSQAHPLEVVLRFEDRAVVLASTRRPRREPPASVGVGLSNLAERCRLTTGQDVSVHDRPDVFAVRLPLLAA
jgi:LytS/YehU family sensor histidine kinase